MNIIIKANKRLTREEWYSDDSESNMNWFYSILSTMIESKEKNDGEKNI